MTLKNGAKSLLILLCVLLTTTQFAKTQSDQPATALPEPAWTFEGRYLVSISDADMVASAYVDGQLGPREGSDALSVIPLGGLPRDYQAFETPATNSVAGPPAALAVSPDGRYAYVVESFTPRLEENENATFSDLAFGTTLTVIDLADPENPTQLQQLQIAERPDSVSVSSDGAWLAVSFHPQGAGQGTPLGIYRLENGQVTETFLPTVPDWNLQDRLIYVEWHPQEMVLALVNETGETVRFVNVATAETGVTLEPWGNEVSVGKAPYIGRFTRDGNHFIVNNLYWGSDVSGTWNEAPRGTIANIRLEAEVNAEGVPRHALNSQVLVGPSPEGFAVSPNGEYVVAVNMERSWLPYDDERITWFSSLSLIERDPVTGAMTYLHTTPYDGILPEAVVFDNSGQNLAVVTHDHFDHTIAGGSVDFFRVASDPLDPNRKMIVQTQWSVPVTRGPHTLVLVP